jgi:hypothetical protein
MSLGQIIMYLALGSEQKYGKPEPQAPTYAGKSHEELAEERAKLRQLFGDIDG